MLAFVTVLAFVACAELELQQRDVPTVALFDTEQGDVPKPTDLLRDEADGRLDFDLEDPDLSDAERALYARLNNLDGWSSVSAASVEFSRPLDVSTVRLGETVHIVRWAETPAPVRDLSISFEDADSRLKIAAPDGGWERGQTFVAFVIGGEKGVRDASGNPVLADETFYFLRQQVPLDGPAHQRAFPGATRAERLEKGALLEETRLELEPYLDYAAEVAGSRENVVSLWSFTITNRVELAMDRDSHRVPIPFDLLRDHQTGLVDLQVLASDKEIEKEAKKTLNRYDGFSISSEILVPFTGPINAASATAQSVRFYRLGPEPTPLEVEVEAFDDNRYLAIRPSQLPLEQGVDYAVVVGKGLVDQAGQPVQAMMAGHALSLSHALLDNEDHSTISAIDDESAAKLEAARIAIEPIFGVEKRSDVVAAWSFRTLEAEDKLDAFARLARDEAIAPTVKVIDRQSALAASLEFALGVSSIASVSEVVTGEISSPYLLDKQTHDFREDGGYEPEPVTFTMTLPRVPLRPMPVVIFGHGIMTERRFVLAIANSLALRGMAAIAIDLPFHGSRTVCVDSSPIALVNPQTGEPTSFAPCGLGASCDPTRGICVDDDTGQAEGFFEWPVLGYPAASGAAFLEIDKLPSIPSHFAQAYVDLGALVYTLEEGDWSQVTTAPIDTTEFYWVGQSLGGIIGAAFVAATPQITRSVFNVPGAGLVNVFDESTFFRPQIDGYFTRNEIERDSYEGRRFLNIARWLVDAVDPHSIAHRYRSKSQRGLIQMALGDIIVPNTTTEALTRISGLPKRDYLGTHGFLTIPEPSALPGLQDMGDFLAGDLIP